MSGTFALIPAKDPALGKSRLASVLSESERTALGTALIRRTFACCVAAFGIERVIVVTRSPAVGVEARWAGIGIVEEGATGGLNAALALAAARALEMQADAAIVVPTDLVNLTNEALLGAMTSLPAAPGCVVVPDRRGEGTNLLGLAPLRPEVFSFGEGSRARHLELARRLGYSVREHHDPVLALDIDLPEDYRLWRGSSNCGTAR